MCRVVPLPANCDDNDECTLSDKCTAEGECTGSLDCPQAPPPLIDGQSVLSDGTVDAENALLVCGGRGTCCKGDLDECVCDCWFICVVY